jgi:hypothetical protein
MSKRWGQISLRLGINSVNAGQVSNMHEHYLRVGRAIERLCLEGGTACLQDTTRFPVQIFVDDPTNPYHSGAMFATMKVTVEYAEWGGD